MAVSGQQCCFRVLPLTEPQEIFHGADHRDRGTGNAAQHRLLAYAELAMSRRKGETTGAMNERDFPHIVELALPPGGFSDQGEGFEEFHRERGIPIRPGRGRHEATQFYVRFCFPNAAAADAFRDRFGGERLTYTRTKPRASKRKSKRIYESRIVADHVMVQENFERLHKFLLETDDLSDITDVLREMIEEEWPELAHKLPPKTLQR